MNTENKNDVIDWVIYAVIVACTAWLMYGVFKIGSLAWAGLGRIL